MCRSMVNIQSPTAEIRRGKKEEEEEGRKEGKKLQGKNIMAPLLHRAAIKKKERNYRMKIHMVSLLHRATIINSRYRQMWITM